jgi:ATP/maltotriose-dependent transcriptional regulator MalT
VVVAEAHLLRGEVDRAGELMVTARAAAAGAGWPVGAGYIQRAEARVAQARGDLQKAEHAARHAIDTFTACGAAAQVARSCLVLAELLAGLGKPDTAASELAAAREAFSHMRAPRLIERTDRLAEKLGLKLSGSASVCPGRVAGGVRAAGS